jgi:hypothetical protein
MNDFIDLILLIARKMLSVYKHKEGYQAEERRLEEQFTADPAAPPVHSQDYSRSSMSSSSRSRARSITWSR